MSKKGFTLIEILIGIALLAILLSLVIVAINPAQRFQDARNTRRWSDVTAVLDAIYLNILDTPNTQFNFSGCPASSFPTTTGTTISTGGADICSCLVPAYMGTMAGDPSTASGEYQTCLPGYETGYEVWQATSTGPIYVNAPTAITDGGEVIQISR